MFTPWVSHARVVEPPICARFTLISFDQGMAEFMENHLAEVVIGIKLILGGNQNATLPVIGCVGIGRPNNPESNPFGTMEPDQFEWILIYMRRNTIKHQYCRNDRPGLVESRLFQSDDGFQNFKLRCGFGINVDFGQHQKFGA